MRRPQRRVARIRQQHAQGEEHADDHVLHPEQRDQREHAPVPEQHPGERERDSRRPAPRPKPAFRPVGLAVFPGSARSTASSRRCSSSVGGWWKSARIFSAISCGARPGYFSDRPRAAWRAMNGVSRRASQGGGLNVSPYRASLTLARASRSVTLRTSARVSWSCAPRLIWSSAAGSNSASSRSLIASTEAWRGCSPPPM